MLQSLRQHVQGWVAGVIASILCLAFALWGIEYYINNGHSEAVVAKVDGVEITQQQLDTVYKRVRQSEQSPEAALNETTLRQLKARALNGLIQEQILVRTAQRAGYVISPMQAAAVVQQIPAFQLQGKFSPELFQRALMNLAYTPEMFSQQIERSLLIQQVQHVVVESDFALPNEVDKKLALQGQVRDLGYVMIPLEPFLAAAAPTDKAINDYYKLHAQEFTTPEQISIQYIVLSTDDMAQKIVVTDAELQQYYAENKAAFTTPAQWRLAHILISVPKNADAKTQAAAQQKLKQVTTQLQAGANFAEVAASHSDNKVSAQKGGDLGWVTRAQQPELILAASALQPGQTSMPFQTTEGWNIVKVEAVKPAEVAPFDSVKAEVEKNVRQQKVDQLVSSESDKLSNLTYTHPDTLKPAADALGLPLQTTELFTRQGDKSGILENPKIINAAFSDLVLKQRSNSDVISLDEHTVAVIRLADYKPAAIQPLTTVQPKIEEALKRQMAQQTAKNLGMQMARTMLGRHLSPQQVAEQNKLTWVQKTAVTRDDKDIPAPVLQFAFNQAAPTSPDKPSIQGVDLPEGGCVVIAVNKVVDSNAATATAEQRNAAQQQLADNLGKLEYDLYLQQQMRKATVKYEAIK